MTIEDRNPDEWGDQMDQDSISGKLDGLFEEAKETDDLRPWPGEEQP